MFRCRLPEYRWWEVKERWRRWDRTEGGRQNTVPAEGIKCQGEPWAVMAWCGQPPVGRGGLWWSVGEGEVVAVL